MAVDTIKQILVNFFELYEADYEVKPVLDKLCIGDVHSVLQTPPEDLDEKSTKEILDSLINDKPLKPGSYRGRKNTAPEKKQSINGENHA